MYIYTITSISENEDGDDICYDIGYITHEKKFSEEEFKKMCNEALSKLTSSKYSYSVSQYLIKNYGFKNIKSEYTFEFEEVF